MKENTKNKNLSIPTVDYQKLNVGNHKISVGQASRLSEKM